VFAPLPEAAGVLGGAGFRQEMADIVEKLVVAAAARS
jgi:hypothetical protein